MDIQNQIEKAITEVYERDFMNYNNNQPYRAVFESDHFIMVFEKRKDALEVCGAIINGKEYSFAGMSGWVAAEWEIKKAAQRFITNLRHWIKKEEPCPYVGVEKQMEELSVKEDLRNNFRVSKIIDITYEHGEEWHNDSSEIMGYNYFGNENLNSPLY